MTPGNDHEHIDQGDGGCACGAYVEHVTSGGATLWIEPAEDGELPPAEAVIDAIADMAFDEAENPDSNS